LPSISERAVHRFPLGVAARHTHIGHNRFSDEVIMFSLGDTPTQAAAPTDLIKDTTEATFMADVIEASRDVPVIVDFWAPWCGPCKTLGPALESAVTAAKGRVKMVKVDVDQNQRIAAQLRVQSIPTVYAFWQGQPVDAFQGALPNSEVKAFVDRTAALGGDGGLSEAITAAEEMLAEGAALDAAETFAAILEEEPENAAAYGGLIRAHLALGNLDQAEAFAEAAPKKIATAIEVEAAKAQIALARQAASAGPEDALRAALAANPDDPQVRFDLALALHAAGKVDEAVDELLNLFRQHREWNDGAARAQLFTIFDALKPQDPIVLKGRRKLSSMIFA
jgi:putative thioredoxin